MSLYFRLAKFFLLAAVINVAIVSASTLFPFIVGKYVWFRTTVFLATICFSLGLATSANEWEFYKNRFLKMIKTPLVICVSVFALVFVLAGFFGVNPSFSFWSNFERGEGGFQMIALYLFFLLLVLLFQEEKDWHKIFWASMIGAVLMILYGLGAGVKYVDANFVGGDFSKGLSGSGGPVFQTFRDFIGPSFQEPNYRFQGSIGNSAYVAGYLIFILFYAGYLLISKYRHRLASLRAISIMSLMALFIIFFFLAATRGSFVGIAIAGLASLLYVGLSKPVWRKKTFIIGGIIIAGVLLMVSLRNSPVIKKLPFARIFDITVSADTFQTRTVIWKIAVDAFKERPIFGWGPENFIIAFDHHFNTKYFVPSQGFGAWFDRAHSIIFDYLAETGMLGLLSFLSIFVAFYWFYFRKRNDTTGVAQEGESMLQVALIFGLPIAYFIQGLVLFDVLIISMNLFLFWAFAVYKQSLVTKL